MAGPWCPVLSSRGGSPQRFIEVGPVLTCRRGKKKEKHGLANTSERNAKWAQGSTRKYRLRRGSTLTPKERKFEKERKKKQPTWPQMSSKDDTLLAPLQRKLLFPFPTPYPAKPLPSSSYHEKHSAGLLKSIQFYYISLLARHLLELFVTVGLLQMTPPPSPDGATSDFRIFEPKHFFPTRTYLFATAKIKKPFIFN